MTKEQKKWFKKLENVLGEIPSSVEIIVQPLHVDHTGTGLVMMVPRGRELQTFEDDKFLTRHQDVAIDSFCAEAITGNSESI